ncbi:MAG TPA: pyridine nucleotide-disulfide oxidoreductase, partial [Usitatibacter sp.]|nr:pyridine nucleotide-disulfide oxidoreductase [Usitatibacter sp.]
MVASPPVLHLAFGLAFEALYSHPGLNRLDGEFTRALATADGPLAESFAAARANPAALATKEEAELLIAVAPHVDRFVAELFDIEGEWEALVAGHHRLAPLFRVKRKFVQRRAMLKIKADAAARLDGDALFAKVAELLGGAFDELVFAERVLEWQADEPAHAESLATLEQFAAWAAHTEEGRWRFRGGVLFKPPQRVDPMHLVPVQTDTSRGYSVHTLHHIRRREGFALTDPGTNLAGALDEANYCIWCHEQEKDSCSKGLMEKGAGDDKPPFKKSPFGVPLAGCPLEERIS